MPSFTRITSRRILLLGATALLLGAIPGCAYDGTGVPQGQLDYQNIAPLYVGVGTVDVTTTYVPSVESSQAADAFGTPPDVALRRYFQSRLKAKGYEGTLKVNIENASVKKSFVPADNKVMKWAKVGAQDRFDLSIRLTMAEIKGDGRQSQDTFIELNRFITVPQSYSIARRETTLREFMQTLMKEVDGMVSTALQTRMHLATSGGDMPAMAPAPVDAQPMQQEPPADTGPKPLQPPPAPEALPPPW